MPSSDAPADGAGQKRAPGPGVTAPRLADLDDRTRQRIAASVAQAPPLNAGQRALLQRMLRPARSDTVATHESAPVAETDGGVPDAS